MINSSIVKLNGIWMIREDPLPLLIPIKLIGGQSGTVAGDNHYVTLQIDQTGFIIDHTLIGGNAGTLLLFSTHIHL